MNISTSIVVTFPPNQHIEDYCPGAIIYLSPPTENGPTFRGHTLPTAELYDSGNNKRFGVISDKQGAVVQAMADFDIFRLEIVVQGISKTFLPAAKIGEFAYHGNDCIGRIVSSWTPPVLPPHQKQTNTRDMLRAVVLLEPVF